MFEHPIPITGDASLIGSHPTDALLARGYRVHTLGSLFTGERGNLSLGDERVELLEGDTADVATLATTLKGCTMVTHLATIASVQVSVDNPTATHQSNFIATLNLYEAMREQGVKCVVFVSSVAVYGQSGEGTATDEDTPKSPLTFYASDELASEYYLDFYRRQHGLEPTIFRSFNIYGPRQGPSPPYFGVINIFTERAPKGTPIVVLGDGERTRDFVCVAGLVDLLVQALEATVVEPGAVNTGLNHNISLKQLLAEISRMSGGLPPVTHADT